VTSVLVVNAGSSSLKLRLLDSGDAVLASADLPGSLDGLDDALRSFPRPDAVGHRIVHGGTRFHAATQVTPEVRRDLEALTDLAPLHQPPALHALDEVSERQSGIPQFACFDTAFHVTIPDAAATYALPAQWRRKWALRKYGFHGLSHAYIARRIAELSPGAARVVSCHLGAGASLCAIQDGRSVDTTMGFTPLDGLVMATRSGSVDPGLVLWLVTHAGLPAEEVNDKLEHASGLLGLAGTADMKAVEASADTAAMDVYLHRLRSCVASMAAALGGLDALVFTGGVGENSALVRSRTMGGLGFLGVGSHDDPGGGQDRPVGDRAYVIAAREDLEIARQVRAALVPGTTTS
jgi:acetate kinase